MLILANNRSSARDVNKEILTVNLKLSQVSNTSVFVKGNYFVLSPSIQNSTNKFDLRKVNLDRYNSQDKKGYLLIRFFDQLLLTDLDNFLNEMVLDINSFENKATGVHWKFTIERENDRFFIISQNVEKKYRIDEVDVETLNEIFNGRNPEEMKDRLMESENVGKQPAKNKNTYKFWPFTCYQRILKFYMTVFGFR